jgi:hypothetical protein
MDQVNPKTLTFRCAAELENLIPRPIPAVLGVPDWYKALPQKAFNPTMVEDTATVKKCPPFIDAMSYGFLMPLAMDLAVQDGEFTWKFDAPAGFVSEHARSPISFYDPSRVAGTPFFDDDQFIITFNNFWTVKAPAGFSLLFTHPVNRTDLPFTTFTGMVDCDTFGDIPLNFPARWHNPDFNGVLPKGTPVAQCLPIKRESWDARFEARSDATKTRSIRLHAELRPDSNLYRREDGALEH